MGLLQKIFKKILKAALELEEHVGVPHTPPCRICGKYEETMFKIPIKLSVVLPFKGVEKVLVAGTQANYYCFSCFNNARDDIIKGHGLPA